MIHVLAYVSHGGGSGILAYLARGFAMSVGWMIARGLGIPGAVAALVVGGVVWWLWRRRS